ncbi:unnamed protein product [Paramecium octaurelia]|uniref:Uncharacterized protein n=1 Tax=Paramecium octaurelia TaxID=43137 RepID=A0A8S1YLE4_PAROT|nr:unnamed protein product [Paramecium octaurelia]
MFKGYIDSIFDMKPNEELFKQLFQGACHLYKSYLDNKNRKQFDVYFSIDMLQWEKQVILRMKHCKIQTKQFYELRQQKIILQKTQMSGNIIIFWSKWLGKSYNIILYYQNTNYPRSLDDINQRRIQKTKYFQTLASHFLTYQ